MPVADGPIADDMRQALDERQDLMEERAAALAMGAVAQRASWVRRLGEPPTDPPLRERWMEQVRVVAAYRDRYGVAGHEPVGADVRTDVQGLDAARARQAAHRGLDIATDAAGAAMPPVLSGQVLG